MSHQCLYQNGTMIDIINLKHATTVKKDSEG